MKCGKCPLNEVHKLVDPDACSPHKGNYNGFQNTFASYFGVDATSGHQLAVPITSSEDVCISCEVAPFPSAFSGFHPEAKCSRTRNLDIDGSDGSGASSSTQLTRQDGNDSCSSDNRRFNLPDGGTVTCSLDYRELNHDLSASSVNSVDQTVLSSCKSHLLYQQASFSSNTIEIEKHQSLDSSSPRVNISPSKLDWEKNYLYHPSVASLRLKNTCNETVLKVYVPFSTDTQFYPFNFSEVVLGPGEVTSISFVFLPKLLGSSSAELVVQTSFGGFLVEAKGFSVESPHRLRPLVGLDVSSGGWLSRNLSLWNPFDETIHLEEVTTWVSEFQSSSPFLAEAICSKHNPEDLNEHSFSNTSKVPTVKGGKFDTVAIRPLSNWVIGPHRTESILQMAFSPNSEGRVLGAICIQLLRPKKGEKDTLVIPFEGALNQTAAWKETASLLSVSMEAVGHCDTNETTISVSVRNSALRLLKIVGISEVSDSQKLLQIKFSGELLLFPGTITLVALVTYESYDSFLQMADVRESCMLQISTNDTIRPSFEIPCQEIFGTCFRKQQESPTPQTVDFNNRRTGYLASSKKTAVSIKAFGGAEADEYMLQSWRDQSTMSGFNVLDDHELLFPMVPIGGHNAKLITVKNPTQQPVIVQLMLNLGEITKNCKDHHGHLHPPSSDNYLHDDSTIPTRYGFSIVESTVTEAYLHPYETASLGPVFFHPSTRCEWKSSVLIRNNLSGVEWLTLRGFGGSHSIVLLDGSELVHRLDFNFNLPSPLNISPPDIASNIQDTTSFCQNSLSKKLLAVNSGDFPIKVQSIHVSGSECSLDGFVVHNCRSISLEPGESVELDISFQTDFSVPVVEKDLELMLATGILVVPLKASLPPQMFNFCRKSIFWARMKKSCVFIILAAILTSLLFWLLMPQMMSPCLMDYLIDGEKSSIHLPKPRDKSSTLPSNQGDEKSFSATKHGGKTENTPSPDLIKETNFPPILHLEPDLAKNAGKLEESQPNSLSVRTRKDRRRRQKKRKGNASGLMSLIEVSSSQSGNSTPSSPLSPVNTSSFSSKETCSPSPGNTEESYEKGEESQPDVKANPREIGNQMKTGNRPTLLPSATFPGPGRSISVLTPGPSSRLGVSPDARAPGPKAQKAVQEAKVEDRFTYDIWGNHFSGLHLMNGVNDQTAMDSSANIGGSDSFFLKGPQQTLFSNCRSRSVK